jgi:hypothetical protein
MCVLAVLQSGQAGADPGRAHPAPAPLKLEKNDFFGTYTRPEEADVTSLLNSICNIDFVVTIVIVQMCLAFKNKKGLSRSLDLD